MKKILAIVLAVVMLLPVFAVNSFAAEGDTKLLLEIGSVTGTLVQSEAQDVVKGGSYTFTAELPSSIALEGAAYIGVKTVPGDNDQKTALPNNSTVTVTAMEIDDAKIDLDASKTKSTVAGGILNEHDGVTLYFGWQSKNAMTNKPANFKKVTVTVEVVNSNPPAADEEIVIFDDEAGIKAGEGKLEDASNPWDFFGMGGLWGRTAANVLDCTADQLKELINKGNVIFSYVCGATGTPGPKLVFNGDFENGVAMTATSIGDGKFEVSMPLDTMKKKWESLGKSVNDITSMVIQHYTSNLVLYSAKFTVKAPETVEPVEKDLFKADGIYDGDAVEPFGENGVSRDGGWFCTFSWKHGAVRGKYADAIQSEGALIEVISNGTIKTAYIQSNKDGYAAVHIEKKASETKTEDGKTVTVFNAKDLVDAYTAKYNFTEDICNVGFDTTGATTIYGIRVYIVTAPEATKKIANYRGCIYVNEQYHAYLVGKYFISAVHEDNGFGFCKSCHAELPADEEDVAAEKVVYDMTSAQGQDTEASLADGIVLADTQEGIGNCRIATNWVGGGKVWGDVTKAIADNADAYVKIVYTGNVDKFVFQSENGGFEQEVAVTETNNEDGKSVAFISCADIIAASPVALSGDFGGWANMMLHFDGEATLYGFSVIIPAPVTLPADDIIEVVDPTEPNTTDEETEEPNDNVNVEEPKDEDKNPPTGIVLAVLPMIIAAAACVASKRK